MPATPTPSGVLFSLTKDASREYAARARSRVLPGWANEVLTKASQGEEVDVVVFQAAVTQVLSLAATRDGQSMGRRNWTREGRHLAYISQAVIESRLAELPPVEPGQRSPKIRALEDEASKLRQEISDLRGQVEASENRVGLAQEEAERAIASGEAAVAYIKEQADEHAVTQRVLGYALRMLNSTQQAKVEGYRDGFKAGRA